MEINNWRLIDAAELGASDSGAALSQPGYALHESNWIDAVVPGTVLTALSAAGNYPDPLYGENMRGIPEQLNKAAYWYRAELSVPEDAAGKTLWLEFAGINYKAEVWVNGRQAGRIDGAFVRGKFDITKLAVTGESAVVAVKILPLEHPGVPHEHTWADGNGKNGGDTAADGPTFCCSIGWDWMPAIRDRNVGIWQPVTLRSTGPVTIIDPYVTTTLPLPRTDSADIAIEVTLRNASGAAQRVTLAGAIEHARFERETQIGAGESATIRFDPSDTPEVRFDNPRLWWPNGYGEPELYTLELSVAIDGGEVSDTQEVVFGIRQFEYSLAGGADVLTICCNGVPIIAKGGNWGMDEAMKRIPKSRFDAQVRYHKEAGCTMLRNWVGQSTAKELYDACDRYGILLWDEFFQPNPCDGPDPLDADLYLANVRDKILRFRNHASVALWCARNEGDPPPVIDAGIAELISELDPVRLYQASSTSGRGVLSHGPYCWRAPRAFYDMPHGAGEAFKTEIGSVSVPTLESVRAMMPESSWGTINDDWAQHDLCAGAQRGDEYPHVMAARYGAPVSLEDFVRKAQLMNYEAYRAMYEGRFAKLFAPVSGILTWMSNPAQPSFVWQYYSHDLEAHSSLYATRKACEPLHIMLNEANDDLMLVNATPRRRRGLTAVVAMYNSDGSRFAQREVPVEAPPSAAMTWGKLDRPETLSDVYFVSLQLFEARQDGSQAILSDNFYWRSGLPGDLDNLRALDALPQAEIDVRAEYVDPAAGSDRDSPVAGAGKKIRALVSNPGPIVALLIHLQLRSAATGQRILPAYYTDNYFTLMPGESRLVEIEAGPGSTGQDNGDFLLALDGWNVGVDGGDSALPGHRLPVIDNPNARQEHRWSTIPASRQHEQINPTFD